MARKDQLTPAGSAAAEALRQELAATNALLSGLGHELQAARVETAVRVEGLRAEQNRERRLRMAIVVGCGVGLITIDGQYAAHCSPGARLEEAITASERGAKRKQLQRIYDHPHSAVGCDVVMPLNVHSSSSWPTPANGVGIGVLILAAAATAAFHRWRTHRDFARVELAARMEDPDGRR